MMVLPRMALYEELSFVCSTEDVVVIHSSLAHFKPTESIQKWDILFALKKLLEAGKTIVLPSFTFSFCGTGEFSKNLPSEVGVVADWALELSGFERTNHPIYSFVLAGPKSSIIVAATNSTTFGEDSAFAVLENLGARIVMLGCSWEYCTQVHRYEEKHSVPYREFKKFTGHTDKVAIHANMYVRNMRVNAQNDFSSIFDKLAKQHRMIKTELWSGAIQSTLCKDIAEIANDYLRKDPFSFVKNKAQIQHLTQQALKKLSAPPNKIALLGNSNLSLIQKELSSYLLEIVLDQSFEIFSTDYGQVETQIFDQNSELNTLSASVTFFINNLPDLVGAYSLETSNLLKIKPAVEQYIDSILHFRKTNSGTIFVFLFEDFHFPVLGNLNQTVGFKPLVQDCNVQLIERLSGINDIHLIDLSVQTRLFKGENILDSRLWFMGRFPYSSGFSCFIAERIAALLLAATGRSIRLIVVDLDNTLWGGVLGEDGIEGLSLGGDYPGNAFQSFQRILKKFSERGVILAVCSKNEEALVFDAIDTLSNMVLKKDDFVAHKINWLPKWQNIIEICNDLNIGLGHVMFVDDNPVERELIECHLPAVKVLDLPTDPTNYIEAILNSPWVECLTLTNEDNQRTDNYKKHSTLQKHKDLHSSSESFFASLSPRISFNKLNVDNKHRALQLIHKTNQFNTTTKRFNLTELENLQESGIDLFVLGVEDRLFDFENIGLVTLRWNFPCEKSVTIDNYLLSCRVLGRGLEHAIVEHIKDIANNRGMQRVLGIVIATERNTPAQNVYRDTNFTFCKNENRWIFDLSNTSYTPEWVSIIHPKNNQEQ
ncbi:MAG: HAD-IIIC family phosphatase [Mariprofundaceae bacterium]|nr:HAD-IIIC family phosphatase [Mariprofundaceae bacterium]